MFYFKACHVQFESCDSDVKIKENLKCNFTKTFIEQQNTTTSHLDPKNESR